MGSKNRSKKRSTNDTKPKQPNDKLCDQTIEQAGDIVYQTEEMKAITKSLPFSSISNKQFQNLGLIPSKRPANQTKTIPLKFSAKLLPIFKKIFNLGKLNHDGKVNKSDQQTDLNYITLISFQNYIQHPDQQIKQCSIKFPTLQINRVPMQNSQPLMGLYLSETNLKIDLVQPQPPKLQLPAIDYKVSKKRSFFNDIWRKKSNPPIATSNNEIDKPTNDTASPNKAIPLPYEPLNPPGTLQQQSTIQSQQSIQPVKLDNCIICKKPAFIAERIQIGPDIFHNQCFKCYQCSKNLYRGKWNKHQDQYVCDNCNKKSNWSFIKK